VEVVHLERLREEEGWSNPGAELVGARWRSVDQKRPRRTIRKNLGSPWHGEVTFTGIHLMTKRPQNPRPDPKAFLAHPSALKIPPESTSRLARSPAGPTAGGWRRSGWFSTPPASLFGWPSGEGTASPGERPSPSPPGRSPSSRSPPFQQIPSVFSILTHSWRFYPWCGRGKSVHQPRVGCLEHLNGRLQDVGAEESTRSSHPCPRSSHPCPSEDDNGASAFRPSSQLRFPDGIN